MKPSDTLTVRKMYDDTADSYAEMMDAEINLPVYADVLGRLKTRIESVTGPLIDTSCGSGHLLSMYRNQFDKNRQLTGLDLSPKMVAISKKRLGEKTDVAVADMRSLPHLEDNSGAAILSFFAIHHLSSNDITVALTEWYRILKSGGQLVMAAWEGHGEIDYGEDSDVVALRYTQNQLASLAGSVGFRVERSVVEPVDEFPMDALYLECVKS